MKSDEFVIEPQCSCSEALALFPALPLLLYNPAKFAQNFCVSVFGFYPILVLST